MLKADVRIPQKSNEQINDEIMQRLIKLTDARKARMAEIEEEIRSLISNRAMNAQQKINRAHMLEKEYNKLFKPPKLSDLYTPPKITEEIIDFRLIHRFKTALLEDNLDFDTIHQNFYSELKNISSIDELQAKYPKIKIPQRPETVIASKIEKLLTRQAYLEFNKMRKENGVPKKYLKEIPSVFSFIVVKASNLYKIDYQELCKKLADAFWSKIFERYAMLIEENKLESYRLSTSKIKPEQIITQNDITLLYTDFDKFVLDTIRAQYLENKRLSEIKTDIEPAKFKEPKYKFEKVSEKIKKIIKIARDIFIAQRNYECFNMDELKSRLETLGNKPEISDNEELYERIIEFASSDFLQEDRIPLIEFLRELDNISDNHVPAEKALQNIYSKNIRPNGTIKFNEKERKITAEAHQKDQKLKKLLQTAKNKFDEAINILYKNDLINLANDCSKYRPNSLDKNELSKAEYIIDLINKYTDKKSLVIKNSNLLSAKLTRWNIYQQYSTNHAQDELFIKAQKYATDKNGQINPEKIGQYIINYKILENYPESLEYSKYREIIQLIMDKTGNNIEKSLPYLIKYEDFEYLPEKEKTYIENYTNMFNTKDEIEKILLKNLITNNYIQTDTTKTLVLNDKTMVDATIAARAKKQIIDKYKFPQCLTFFEKFEDALTKTAVKNNDYGIKKVGTNNKQIHYLEELKIIGFSDRLFSTTKSRYFDEYSEIGLH